MTTGGRDAEGNTRLHLAVKAGDLKAVEELVRSNADVNARNSRMCTPLHLAAEAGRLDVVQALLKVSSWSTLCQRSPEAYMLSECCRGLVQ